MKTKLIMLVAIGALFALACSDDSRTKKSNTDSATTTGLNDDSSSTFDSASSSDITTDSTVDTNSSVGDTDSSSAVDTAGDTTVGTSSDSTVDTLGDTSADTVSDSAVDTSTSSDSSIDTATATTGGETDSTPIVDTDSIVDTGVVANDSDTTVCLPVLCGDKYYMCADCIDNDSDGKVDAADPDCLTACDNNEAGFNINIPGSAPSGCTMDCYFDADNGAGNDNCAWDYTCDIYDQFIKAEGDKYCVYDATDTDYCEGMKTSQPATCGEICAPLVPNGCDCWGCCNIEGSGVYRFIGTPGCTLENYMDTDACSPCVPVPSCINECGQCELCIGMTELDSSCLTPVVDTDTTDTDTGTDPALLRCPDGRQPCGQTGDALCAPGYYCITGCCTEVILN
ncbi:MAG: hypothetical protein JXR76_31105 [Deltaproteobacteria bacterium]|nr:hypothetical protein [Deltaproteobacteria bacterium]